MKNVLYFLFSLKLTLMSSFAIVNVLSCYSYCAVLINQNTPTVEFRNNTLIAHSVRTALPGLSRIRVYMSTKQCGTEIYFRSLSKIARDPLTLS